MILQSPPGISSPNREPKKEGTDMALPILNVVHYVTIMYFDPHNVGNPSVF